MTLDAFYALPEEEQDLRYAEDERSTGTHSCGHTYELCGDSSKPWYPQRHVCYADMERASAQRIYDALHEARPWHDGSFQRWSSERSKAFPFHHSDGVTITVADEDLNPDDHFLSAPDAHYVGQEQQDDHGQAEDSP